MKPIGALFDLDGVLIDSEGLYTEFWAEIGHMYKLPSPTFAHDIKGCTLKDILNRYFPDPLIQTELVERIHEYEDNMRYELFPHVESFLSELKNNGVKMAIVTSSDDTKMSYLFEQHPGLKDKFDAIVTGSMVSKSKPDPEGYLTATRLIGCEASDCFVFEDSFQGLEAGRRSGAHVVALATTNSSELLKGKACKIIDGFAGFGYSDLIALSD